VSKRIDRFALLATPRTNSTRLVLQSAETPAKPLVGYELYAKNVYEPPASETPAPAAAPPSEPAASAPAAPADPGAQTPAAEEDEQGLN
jgi:hypothetical protein